METPGERAKVNRSNEIRSGLQIFSNAIQEASKRHSPQAPNQAREAIGIALVGVIQLISDLYPNEPSLPRPLNELLYGLRDLDRGKVAPFLKSAKVSHSPGTALSEALFRAIAAAAMTRLVDDTKMSRAEAADDIARRLSRMGAKQSSGKTITASQIGKWRETMRTERASENLAVARYHLSLQWVIGMEPIEAVKFLLGSLTDLSPANFPKKPALNGSP